MITILDEYYESTISKLDDILKNFIRNGKPAFNQDVLKHIRTNKTIEPYRTVVNRAVVYWSPVWKHMRKLTGKDIEKRAVMELVTYVEKLMDKVIIQSTKEMEQLNENKKIQGIYQKCRITDEAIKRAIKTINASEYPLLSEMTGGTTPKNTKKIETNLKEENILTEVT